MTEPRRLYGLTLWRPWPNLIERGIKRIENRPWHPRPRLSPGDWFAIHAGKHWDDSVIGFAMARGVAIDVFDQVPQGVITCVARYDGHTDDPEKVPADQRAWWMGPIAWLIGDVQPVTPIPCKGAQGLWVVPDEIAEELRAAFKRARSTADAQPAAAAL